MIHSIFIECIVGWAARVEPEDRLMNVPSFLEKEKAKKAPYPFEYEAIRGWIEQDYSDVPTL